MLTPVKGVRAVHACVRISAAHVDHVLDAVHVAPVIDSAEFGFGGCLKSFDVFRRRCECASRGLLGCSRSRPRRCGGCRCGCRGTARSKGRHCRGSRCVCRSGCRGLRQLTWPLRLTIRIRSSVGPRRLGSGTASKRRRTRRNRRRRKRRRTASKSHQRRRTRCTGCAAVVLRGDRWLAGVAGRLIEAACAAAAGERSGSWCRFSRGGINDGFPHICSPITQRSDGPGNQSNTVSNCPDYAAHSLGGAAHGLSNVATDSLQAIPGAIPSAIHRTLPDRSPIDVTRLLKLLLQRVRAARQRAADSAKRSRQRLTGGTHCA